MDDDGWWIYDGWWSMLINDDQWWSMLDTYIQLYTSSKLFTVSHVDSSNSILHKSCLRGGIYFSQKSRLQTMQPNHAGTSFWRFVPAWADTSMFSRYIQTRPCKVFSVPTTPENDWNLKIQTSPRKEKKPLTQKWTQITNLYWFLLRTRWNTSPKPRAFPHNGWLQKISRWNAWSTALGHELPSSSPRSFQNHWGFCRGPVLSRLWYWGSDLEQFGWSISLLIGELKSTRIFQITG